MRSASFVATFTLAALSLFVFVQDAVCEPVFTTEDAWSQSALPLDRSMNSWNPEEAHITEEEAQDTKMSIAATPKSAKIGPSTASQDSRNKISHSQTVPKTAMKTTKTAKTSLYVSPKMATEVPITTSQDSRSKVSHSQTVANGMPTEEQDKQDKLADEKAHREQSARSMMQWAADEGIDVAYDLRMMPDNQGGISAVAGRTIEPGETILLVPPKLALCANIAFETFGPTSEWASKTDKDKRMDGDMELALSLLVERSRGDESKWRHYISALPREMLPIHRMNLQPIEEVKRMTNGTIVDQVVPSSVVRVRRHMEVLVAALPVLRSRNSSYPGEGFHFTEQDALWAISMIKSRVFSNALHAGQSVHKDYDGTYNCMVPVADMLNHHPDAPSMQTIPHGVSAGGLGFIAKHRIEKGEPVYDSYGNLPLEVFYNNYGFATKENKPTFGLELADIIMAQDPKDPLSHVRQKAYLAKGCVDIMGSTKRRSYAEHVAELLLPCARIVEVTHASMVKAIERDPDIMKDSKDKGVDEIILQVAAKATSASFELRANLRLFKLHQGYLDQDAKWRAENPPATDIPDLAPLRAMRDMEMEFHREQVALYKASMGMLVPIMNADKAREQKKLDGQLK